MLAIAFLLISILVGIFSIRSSLILVVFGSIFMSRYFGFQTSELGSPITFIRFFLPLSLILITAIIFSGYKFSLPKLNLFSIGIMHVLLVTFSTILNGNLDKLPYCFDWFFSTYVFVFFGWYCARFHQSEKFILRLVFLSSITLAFLAIIEFFLGQTIISIFSDIGLTSVDILREKVFDGRERYGILRAQVFSDNPLRLAQFCNLLFALTIYFRSGEHSKLYFLVTPLLLVTILLTGSRSGLVLFAVLFFLDIYRSTPTLKQKFLVKFFNAFLIVSFMWICWFVLEIVLLNQELFSDNAYWMYESQERSTIERSFQVMWVVKQFLLSPIYGFGFLPNTGENLNDIASLDSYFLRSLVEGGVIGWLLFMAFLLRYVPKSYRDLSDRSAFGYLLIAISVLCGSIFEYSSETFIFSFFFLGYFEKKIFSETSEVMSPKSSG